MKIFARYQVSSLKVDNVTFRTTGTKLHLLSSNVINYNIQHLATTSAAAALHVAEDSSSVVGRPQPMQRNSTSRRLIGDATRGHGGSQPPPWGGGGGGGGPTRGEIN